ncbi:MAG: YihA family ribosome biogenesis GTP-binding protein [Gammaproteobacteria bacterium]|nr:YihA family ribosome biogenesis GTP-binding protein [Gammaproteobacteria bacterium]MBK9470333.1 YihA family ribosome biogenesis GTP-binding protein [Gammaproteobacteria bacterium]
MSSAPEPQDYRNATFILSAAKLGQCPADVGVEVAFAGRSNAGKSSAINAICDHNKLARASKTPGRTQQINFFALAEDKRLVDLPGYGFARVPLEVRAQWTRLVENYLGKRRSLAGIVLLMDVRHPLKDQDRDLIGWAAALGIPLHVLLTKSDKLSRGPGKSTLLAVRRELASIPATTVQLFSALSGEGIDEARKVLDQWYAAPREADIA